MVFEEGDNLGGTAQLVPLRLTTTKEILLLKVYGASAFEHMSNKLKQSLLKLQFMPLALLLSYTVAV